MAERQGILVSGLEPAPASEVLPKKEDETSLQRQQQQLSPPEMMKGSFTAVPGGDQGPIANAAASKEEATDKDINKRGDGNGSSDAEELLSALLVGGAPEAADDDADTVTGDHEERRGEAEREDVVAEVGDFSAADTTETSMLLSPEADEEQQQASALFGGGGGGGVASPVNNKQDYRLDFTEVEGTLEAVPEEVTAAATTTTNTCSSTNARMTATATADTIVGVGIAAPTVDEVLAGNTSTNSNIINSNTLLDNSFHVPESNASDAAFSEYSFQAESVGTHYTSTSHYIRSSEPLTARQQVALWLTRTSMSDMSSMPSLRSLIFPKLSSSRGGGGGGGGGGPNSTFGGSNAGGKSSNHHHQSSSHHHHQKSRRNKSEIQRNFSTKSLISHGVTNKRGDPDSGMLPSSPPMRKCNTLMSLPAGGSSNSSRPIAVPRGGGGGGAGGAGGGYGAGSRSRKSSFNLFRRLATARKDDPTHVGRGGGKMPGGTAAFSFTSVGSGCESPFRTPYGQGIQPVNRLRSTTSSVMMCSRCSYAVSFSNSRLTSRAPSQNSIFMMPRKPSLGTEEPELTCKICLMDSPLRDMAKLQDCGCLFCKECMLQYVMFEVSEGAYDISCPDPECEKQGVLQLLEVEAIAGGDVAEKHRRFRLNTEVALDRNRTWCPAPDCGTICHICQPSSSAAATAMAAEETGVAVSCPSCSKEFCSLCSANFHPGKTCAQNGEEIVRSQEAAGGGIGLAPAAEFLGGASFLGGDIKPCPMCRVPIERDAGCAQMMCKRCKHVFCWFCLASLDDDFLLRHYDSGRCKGKLGHSRASVLIHRAQVIGIFAGFGILLLVASPLLLLAAPCILCCKCKLLEKLDSGGGAASAAGDGVEERGRSESKGSGGGGGRGESDEVMPNSSSSSNEGSPRGHRGNRSASEGSIRVAGGGGGGGDGAEADA